MKRILSVVMMAVAVMAALSCKDGSSTDAPKNADPSSANSSTSQSKLSDTTSNTTGSGKEAEPIRQIPADFVPYELSEDESKKYQKGGPLTVKATFNQAVEFPRDLAAAQKFYDAIGETDSTNAKDRSQLVKQYVEIFGRDRVKEMGPLIFYGADGRAKYIWPRPSTQ